MQITRIEQAKKTNLRRHLLLLFLLISFSFSTIDKINDNPNPNKEFFLEKLYSDGMSFLEDEDNFIIITSMIETEKNEIINIKNYIDFFKTLTYKLISIIHNNIDISNNKIMSFKENFILDILIIEISEILYFYIENNTFFNETILDLIYILKL